MGVALITPFKTDGTVDYQSLKKLVEFQIDNGADFLCVGMFDFQVVSNVNTMIDLLANLNDRKRKWYS